jgi:ChrB-like protein
MTGSARNRRVQPALRRPFSLMPKTSEAETRQHSWVLLAFRLPREPSTPRIAVWRKLKRLGVAQLLDGLVALPLDSRNREQLEWLADDVGEAGGEATIWVGALASKRQERQLVARMRDSVATDYRALIADAEAVRSQAPGPRRRSLGRLRRELRRVRLRDYFPPPERELAQQAIDELAAAVEELVA